MSSISSTANAGLYQFIQGLSSESTASTATGTSAAGVSTSTSGTTGASGTTATTAGGHHHHHGGGFGKIADAVTSALQSASTDGSDSTDPNQAITNALTQLFQGGTTGSTSTTASGATSVAATGAAATSTEAAPGSNAASFEQTLKSYGVTQQQFQTDLQTAIKNAQASGNFDSSSFPAGSFVDATA